MKSLPPTELGGGSGESLNDGKSITPIHYPNLNHLITQIEIADKA